MYRSKSITVGALLCGVLLVATACAKNSSPPSGGAGSGGTGSGAAAGGSSGSGSIVLGSMQDLSGPIGPYGQSIEKGIQVAVDEFNQAGGLNGRQVKIDSVDLGSNKSNAPSAVRKLAGDGAVGIIGPTSSSALILAAPVAEQLKIVTLAPTSTDSLSSSVLNDWVKRTAPIEAPAFPTIFPKMLAAAGHPKKIAMFYDSANQSSIEELALLKKYQSQFGYSLVDVETSPEGSTNVTNQVSKIVAANPDAIYISHLTAESAAFMKDVRARGDKAVFIGGPAFSSAQIFQLAGRAGDGSITFVPFLATSTRPASQQFVKDFKAKFNSTPDLFAAEGHDGALAMLTAMKNAGSTDRTKIQQAFSTIKHLPAATGQITFGSGSDNTTPTYILVKSENGVFQPING